MRQRHIWIIHSPSKCLVQVACLWSKMPMFQRSVMREGGLLLPLSFFIWFLWHIFLWGKFVYDIFTGFKMASPQSWDAHRFMNWNWSPLYLKSWHFEASVHIMTKFKSQALQIIRIKYWNSAGSDNPPSLIPAHWNISILLH